MNDMNKMLEKVQKLLALAGNNPSEAEAKAAAAKAQKLIAEYNLDLSQLSDEEKIQYKLIKARHSNNEGYRGQLSLILAENFRCKAIYIGGVVHFFGREGDAETCTEVFNYTYRTMHNAGLRKEREARKRGESTHGVANSYWAGYMKGLKDILGEQSKALMIIVPEDVKEHFSERFPSLGNGARYGMRSKGLDSDAYTSGYWDGRRSMSKGALTE